MITHLKDPKNSTKKLLDIINTFSKVSGHKINFKKLVALLYTNSEETEKEYRKTIPFRIGSKS
jgi:Ca2+-binding EF-hand superfamily protein